MNRYSVKYYPRGDCWSIYPIVRVDFCVSNRVKVPTETEPYYQIILDSNSIVKAVASAEQAFMLCQENAQDKLWRKDFGQL